MSKKIKTCTQKNAKQQIKSKEYINIFFKSCLHVLENLILLKCHTTQSDLQFNAIAIQILMALFERNRKTKTKQQRLSKDPNNQKQFEKEKQSQMTQTS